MRQQPRHWSTHLSFYYGWVIVAAAFVTIGVAVTARTAYSLLLPALVAEFGWDRGLAAGAFSFGFLVSALTSPLIGMAMDRQGPRVVVGCGVACMTAGLLLAPRISEPWHLYVTLGVLVGAGSNLMSYTAHSLFLPHWFERRRGLAISIAFSGAGVGALVLLPLMQTIIQTDGWRTSCQAMGCVVLLVVGPLCLLLRHRPEEIGLVPDGTRAGAVGAALRPDTIVDRGWTATEWTLGRAMTTARFWWIALGYFCALFAWYAVQVHQTKYLVEVGFTPLVAAWSLGIVSTVAIPGQIGLGALSDRIGREWVWTIACAGFAVCYSALIALEHAPSLPILYLMIVAQGLLGYAMTSVMGPIVAEIFEGPHYGTIFGAITVALAGGGAAGPWVAGVIHDASGSYRPAFGLAIVLCALSAVAIWLAAPRKVRRVPGRAPRS